MQLTEEEKKQIVEQAIEGASRILLFAWYICELKTHITSDVENEGQKFKLKFYVDEILNEDSVAAPTDKPEETKQAPGDYF